MADTMDYKSFREAILKDFDNNLSGLEIELSKIISNKFGDVKLNPTQLRGAIKDALQVAVRDIKGDEVDKISLTDFIDDDPKELENKLKSSSKEISQYIGDIKDLIKKQSSKEIIDEYRQAGLQSAQEFLGAYRTAIARGQVDKFDLGFDKSELFKIEKGIIETGIVTKQTVSNINGYLANIGVNVNSEKITEKIKGLSEQDIQKLFDAVNLQFDSSGMIKSFQSITNQAKFARNAINDVAGAYEKGIPFAEGFANANERVATAFQNIDGNSGASDTINTYVDKLKEATDTINGLNNPENSSAAKPSVPLEEIRQASTETADVVVHNNRREAESFERVEDAAGRISELKQQLMRQTFVNSFYNEPHFDFEFDKNVEMAQFLKRTLEELSALDPSITVEKLLQEAEQGFNKTNDAVKHFNDTLQEVRKGTKEWSLNKLLNDADGFAKRFNELAVRYDELIHTDNYDPKIALNLEARMHSMLAAQHRAYDGKEIYQPYIDQVQHQLNDVAKRYQDQFWDAIANGGNLMSRDDLKYAVEHQLGVKDYSFELEQAQKYLNILQNIQQVLSYDGGQGAVDFYTKAINDDITTAEELKQRLLTTSKEDRDSDPEWVQNQYKYITEYLQSAEEYKRKLAEVKGELYEINQVKLEDVTRDLQSQMGESPTQIDRETDALRQNSEERERNIQAKEKGQQITGGADSGKAEEQQTDQVRQHREAQEQLNDQMRKGQEIQEEAQSKPPIESKNVEEQIGLFEELYDIINKVDAALTSVGNKKININIKGLKEITEADLTKKLEVLKQSLGEIADRNVNINIKSLKDFKTEEITEKLNALKAALTGISDVKVNINLKDLKELEAGDLDTKLTSLKTSLQDFPDKTISVNISSLKELTDGDITTRMTALKTVLQDFPEKSININLKSLQDFNVDDLNAKLTILKQILSDFSDKKININLKSLKEIGIDELESKLRKLKEIVEQFPDKKIGVNLGSLSKVSAEDITQKLEALRLEVERFPDKKIGINLGSLKTLKVDDIRDRMEALRQSITAIGDKKISINLDGLKEVDANSIQSKLSALAGALKPFEEIKGIDLKGFNALNKILALDQDPEQLAKKFDDLAKAVKDFAVALQEIPMNNMGFLSSISQLIENGDKLANLATVIKAKQSDIDKAQNAIGSKPPKITEDKRIDEIKRVEEAIANERKELERLDQAYADFEVRGGSFSEMAELQTASWSRRNNIKNLSAELERLQEPLPKPIDYSNAVKEAKEYYQIKLRGDNATQEEIDTLNKIETKWHELNGAVDEVTASLEKQGKSTKAISEFTNMYANRMGTGLQQYANEYIKKAAGTDPLKYLSEKIIAFDQKGKYTNEVMNEAKRLKNLFSADYIGELASNGSIDKINGLVEAFKKLKAEASSMEGKLVKPIKISGLLDEMSKYLSTYSGLSKQTREEIGALISELSSANNISVPRFNQIVETFNNIKVGARQAGEETKSFWSKLGTQVEHLNAQAFAMYLSWQDIIRYIRQAAGAVIELDSALTELRKVSDASTERLQQSFETSAKTAKELGSTVDAVINQTADWSRLKNMDGRMVTCAMELA